MRIPIRVRRQGVLLDDLLEGACPAASVPHVPRTGWFPLAVSLLVFVGVFGSGLAWLGVHRLVPGLSGQTYRRTLPVAGVRVHPGLSRLPDAGAALLAPWAGNRLHIPSLGLSLPLVRALSLGDRDIESALTRGVTLYPNGIEPGNKGNVVVTAHSTAEPWKGPFRFAFLNVRKLQRGDTVALDYGPRRYTYAVTGQRRVDPREVPSVTSEAPASLLTLVTCWPLWSTAERLLVEATLVDVRPLSPAPVVSGGGAPGVFGV